MTLVYLIRSMLGLGLHEHGSFFVFCCLHILVLFFTVWLLWGQVDFLLDGVNVRVRIILFLSHKWMIVVYIRVWVVPFAVPVSVLPALEACSSDGPFLHIVNGIRYKRSDSLAVLATFFLNCPLQITVATLSIFRRLLDCIVVSITICSVLVAASRSHRLVIILWRMSISTGRM